MRFLILIFSILILTSCHKNVPNYKTLKELTKTAGMISECQLNNINNVYTLNSVNAFNDSLKAVNGDLNAINGNLKLKIQSDLLSFLAV